MRICYHPPFSIAILRNYARDLSRLYEIKGQVYTSCYRKHITKSSMGCTNSKPADSYPPANFHGHYSNGQSKVASRPRRRRRHGGVGGPMFAGGAFAGGGAACGGGGAG
ncbi:hypothetical protein EJ03DRAFT_194082 [Teratosphaeria nubilosa]|uniref:Uncharacterized protein n=1 Tax=Teratosphaeria nubilosa TaxID=161662 RepID=A0A6G1L096_9PEZI|nr:hypothetical protein EJ03DRAFT_194082 [Teratosphaeria nubilosa]